jgi:uncharacterized protein YjbJ (UPF0337 family)
MNENTIKGKWTEIKGEIQKAWGKLTDDELETAKGDMKAISGIIQQRYGEAEENSKTRLHEIVQKFDTNKDALVQDVKTAFKN